MKNYEAAAYNVEFISLLFVKDAEGPAIPERKNKSRPPVTTNDAGLAMLKGFF